MKRNTALALIAMWGVVLFMLVSYSYQNPGMGILSGNNPIPQNPNNPNVFDSLKQFYSDMSNNLQIPKGLG